MPEITLVLHNIRSAHNVGSIFRTAEGFGVARIICSGYTPHPAFEGDARLPHLAQKITRQIHKTALGAEAMVPFEYAHNIDSKIAELAQNNVPLYALEQTPSSISLKTFTPLAKFALVLGEEVYGVPPEILAQCRGALEIPMRGQKESFNVSVATGITLYALTA